MIKSGKDAQSCKIRNDMKCRKVATGAKGREGRKCRARLRWIPGFAHNDVTVVTAVNTTTSEVTRMDNVNRNHFGA